MSMREGEEGHYPLPKKRILPEDVRRMMGFPASDDGRQTDCSLGIPWWALANYDYHSNKEDFEPICEYCREMCEEGYLCQCCTLARQSAKIRELTKLSYELSEKYRGQVADLDLKVKEWERKAFERSLEVAKLEGKLAAFIECDDPETCAQDHKKVHDPDEVIFGARDGKLKIYHKVGE